MRVCLMFVSPSMTVCLKCTANDGLKIRFMKHLLSRSSLVNDIGEKMNRATYSVSEAVMVHAVLLISDTYKCNIHNTEFYTTF